MRIKARNCMYSNNIDGNFQDKKWFWRDAKAGRPEAGSNHKERWETGIKYSLLLAFVTCISALCG